MDNIEGYCDIMADTCSDKELESKMNGSASEHDIEMLQLRSSAPCAPTTNRRAHIDFEQENIDRSIVTMKKLANKKTDLWCLAFQLTMKKLPPEA